MRLDAPKAGMPSYQIARYIYRGYGMVATNLRVQRMLAPSTCTYMYIHVLPFTLIPRDHLLTYGNLNCTLRLIRQTCEG